MIAYTDEEVEETRQETIAGLLESHEQTLEEIVDGYQNALGLQEALHASFIFMENVNDHLLDHPCVALDHEAHRHAHAASTALFNLYQRLGELRVLFLEQPRSE